MSNPLLDTSSLPRFADIEPAHALPAVRHIIAEHRRMLAELLDSPDQGGFAGLVTPLEEMSHELRRVWSPVGHLQAVLEDPAWREAFNACLPLLTEHSTDVSQNRKLFEAFERLAGALPADATPSQKTLVEHALRDFRLAGVDLDNAKKERFKALMQELSSVQADFDQRLQDATDHWHYATTDAEELAGLPPSILARAQQEAEGRGHGGWWLTLDHPTYQAVMLHADDRRLRERFYRAWSTRASDQGGNDRWDNSENIRRILALRHEAAQLTGFGNYAEYSLATKMAGGTADVIAFLEELAARTRPAAEREFAEVAAFAGQELEAWDVGYYLEQLKQERYAIADDVLRRYFPVDRALSGLFETAERLYGIRLAEAEGIQTWDATVRYYDVSDERGNVLGGFYTDLFARTGKRGGAWIDECVVRKNLDGSTIRPVGYLVCNFSPPDAQGISLLTHNDVLTLFHEFGHMLHHLLTRVDYPSIAGINGVPWDAVELPSQFMENFAWSHEVLERCSAHVETGDPLPAELFERLQRSRYFGAPLAMLRQLEFALFDFRLHAEYEPGEEHDVLRVLREVRDAVSLIQHPEYNRLPHSFSHIFAGGYAAGYYSYKWAEVLAADAFGAFEEAGIFDRQTAARFREEILEIGGSRDIMEAYVAFRGRKPTLDALLRRCGIDEAA